MVVFLFSVLGAAVFAEPTVAKIEEMIGLLHKGDYMYWCRVPRDAVLAETRHQIPDIGLLWAKDSAPAIRTLGETHWHSSSPAVPNNLYLHSSTNLVLI
jgi:hypothetical protein